MSEGVIFGAHITIQSLCAHRYSVESYAEESGKLLGYGFIQLRSRRGKDACFWELWYLPGVLFAKGKLKEAIDLISVNTDVNHLRHRTDKERLKAAVDFLRQNVIFGTLDVSVQRLAMIIE